jgi:hypothetical protein
MLAVILGVIWFGFAVATSYANDRASGVQFQDRTEMSGVSFRFENGSRNRHDLPEIMGGGLALADFDGDGRVDLYLCNGGPLGPPAGIQPGPGLPRGSSPAPALADPPCRLYRNLGGGRFADQTDAARAPGPSVAMGAAVGDYDGDGRVDLFVTGWRDQRLYRNLGGLVFEDVTDRAGLKSHLWSTSAAFADLDGDGDLDLYVANYLTFNPDEAPFCAAPDGRRDYCGPEDFPAEPDRLYRNEGDGTFTERSATAGIDLPDGRGLGVLIADLTGDRRPDVYVANDGTDAWLFENQGAMRFREIGLEAGVARDGQGEPMSGMGVSLGDLDGDGRSDLVVSNFLRRGTIAFQSRPEPEPGSILFRDSSAPWGLTRATRSVLGFGIALVDFDADSRLDLLQVNGHVLDRDRLGEPMAMRPTLLRGTGRQPPFADVAAEAGPWFERPAIGRGLAVGDLDGDSRPDVVVNAISGTASLLHNASAGESFAVALVDRQGRPAFGGRVRARIGEAVLIRELVAGGSYLATSEPLIFLARQGARQIDRLEVSWPWGQEETWTNLSPPAPGMGRIEVRQGTGQAFPSQSAAEPVGSR